MRPKCDRINGQYHDRRTGRGNDVGAAFRRSSRQYFVNAAAVYHPLTIARGRGGKETGRPQASASAHAGAGCGRACDTRARSSCGSRGVQRIVPAEIRAVT